VGATAVPTVAAMTTTLTRAGANLSMCAQHPGGRRRRRPPTAGTRSLFYCPTANTQTTPPCGTSFCHPTRSESSPCWNAGTTPPPEATAMYCTPSTANDEGGAVMPELVRNCHRTSPVLASNARKYRSLVPPLNTRPPAVVITGPQFIESGNRWLQTRLLLLT